LLTAINPATAKVLARAGLSIDVIDAFEVNEAFASVVLCWLADTAADRIAQTRRRCCWRSSWNRSSIGTVEAS
jgi:acetyl-CoA acetyltransferase